MNAIRQEAGYGYSPVEFDHCSVNSRFASKASALQKSVEKIKVLDLSVLAPVSLASASKSLVSAYFSTRLLGRMTSNRALVPK